MKGCLDEFQKKKTSERWDRLLSKLRQYAKDAFPEVDTTSAKAA
jgi:hypothetical protein